MAILLGTLRTRRVWAATPERELPAGAWCAGEAGRAGRL